MERRKRRRGEREGKGNRGKETQKEESERAERGRAVDECFAELIRGPDVNFKLESCMAHTYEHRNSFSLIAAAVAAFIRSLVAADRVRTTDDVAVVIIGS